MAVQSGRPAFGAYLKINRALAEQYAAARDHDQIPVTIALGKQIKLTPGDHAVLIKAIIEKFAPRFAPGSVLVYAATRVPSGATLTKNCFASWV